jgi:fatty acid desaturase
LKLKKAWEVAIAPAKQLPMSAFGMYMSGNSLQIFSIMMVFMLFKGPITAIFNIQNVFARFESEGTRDRLIMVKLAYVACNFLALALGIWKVNGMGLLPYVFYLLYHTSLLLTCHQYYSIRLARLGNCQRASRKGLPQLHTMICPTVF